MHVNEMINVYGGMKLLAPVAEDSFVVLKIHFVLFCNGNLCLEALKRWCSLSFVSKVGDVR